MCKNNRIDVNETKSNGIHVHTPSLYRTNFDFSCCGKLIPLAAPYNYLGFLSTEFRDLGAMASTVAKSASRTLGIVIYKCKLNGGLPFKRFTYIYDSLVWPIIVYGFSF